MHIIVVDDQPTLCQQAVLALAEFQRWAKVTMIERINPACPAEEVANAISALSITDREVIVVLDLGLGQRLDDGLVVARCLKPSFAGTIVLHSDSITIPEVKARAIDLGIRFGVKKLAPELARVVDSVTAVAHARFQIIWFAQEFLCHRPVIAYDPPTEIRQLLWRVWQLGHHFDGSAESVNWEEAEQLTEEICRHAKLATAAEVAWNQELYKRADGNEIGSIPCFPEGYATGFYAFLTDLASNLRHAVERVAPYLLKK